MTPAQDQDRGSVTLFVVVFFIALLAAVGLVVDGGAKLRAARHASAIAEAAARAGAGHIERDRAYAHGNRFVIDPDAALPAARRYLATTEAQGNVTVTGTRKVRVTVTVSKPTLLLAAIGITNVHATKTANADLLQGITEAR